MAVFLFAGISMSHMLFDRVREEHHWAVWNGTFEDVLPYIRQAFDEAMVEFGYSIPNEQLRAQLVTLVQELCDPDPRFRGDKINRVRGGNPFSLERYVTRFDLLARRASRGDYN
jgi:hypothetical protein